MTFVYLYNTLLRNIFVVYMRLYYIELSWTDRHMGRQGLEWMAVGLNFYYKNILQKDIQDYFF